MDKLQVMVATVALEKMFSDGNFSICALDKILKLSGGCQSRPDYEMLSALHCVNYSDMPKELLKEFPAMIKRVIAPESESIYVCVDKLLNKA